MNLYLEAGAVVVSVVGAIGFLWSSWDATNWLLPLQWGCGLWIVGCTLFMGSLIITRHQRLVMEQQKPHVDGANRLSCSSFFLSRWTVSEICQLACQLLFLTGCTLVMGTEAQVLERLPASSNIFMTGSLLLVVDGAWTVRSLSREADTAERRAHRLAWEALAWNSVVALCFVYAAILGGYGKTPSIIRAGTPGWMLGSLAAGVVPFRNLLRKRHSEKEDSCDTVETMTKETNSLVESDECSAAEFSA